MANNGDNILKPRVLILGGKKHSLFTIRLCLINRCVYLIDVEKFVFCFLGCGFIGRNLVSYLVSNKLVSFVRIVDKVPPQVAWLNSEHEAIFNCSNVEFRSANLINSGKIHKIYFNFLI